MTISRLAAVAVFLLAASSPFTSAQVTSAQAAQKLSAGEIAALFPGTFEAIWKDRHQVHIVAGRDGEVRGSAGILSDSGQWSINGDRLCVAFRWWTRDRERCTEVLHHGGWYFGLINRQGQARVKFRPQ